MISTSAKILFLAIVAFVVVFTASNIPKEAKSRFDERQQAARAQAWKWAYLTMTLYSVASWWYIWAMAEPTALAAVSVSAVGLALSYAVQNIICVVKDAITPVGRRSSAIMIPSAAVIFAVNLVTMVTDGRPRDGEWLLGVRTYAAIIMIFLAVSAVSLVKWLRDKRREREDAEQ